MRTLFLALLVVVTSCMRKEPDEVSNQVIWFKYPARYWNSQALHLGNGYFGASFFGGPGEEVFALSEASMWTGGPAMGDWERAGVNPNARETLPAIRKAVLEGNIRRADSLVSENFFGSFDLYGHFTSIGNLRLKFLDHETEPGNYHRELDIRNSLGGIRYDLGNTTFNREYFCSYPDRVLVMKFTADRPGSISFDMTLDIMQDSSIVEISGNTCQVAGYIDGNQRPFHLLIQVNHEGGKTGRDAGVLTVRGADAVEVYYTVATNYKMSYPGYTGEDPAGITRAIMQKAAARGFETLKEAHTADYRSLYDRVNLVIQGNRQIERLPTNKRYERLKSGKADPGYKVLAFNLGRYMIISSSRPNTLPANIQGVWNTFYAAPWAGNYQSNINVQEIFWSCGPTDLAECQQSYIDWIENLAISGREIARLVYGTGGWVSHTVGNIWGHAAPIGSHPWGMFPMGAAWHCQHVWDQYAFTRDEQYLKDQAYPLLKDAALFWLENLVPFEEYWITSPSVSAEHGALMTENGLNPAFHDFESDQYLYNLPGVYQDMELIWDLFTNTAKAANILGEEDFADSLLQTREQLLPLQIGRYGQLQEWYQDIDHPDCHHRHIAHLYAVCPGTQIHPTITPELAEAAKISLDMRGDGRYLRQEMAAGGNWARAHRMWCWTRLMDGDRASKILTEMLTEQGFENGLTYQHAVFGFDRDDLSMEGELYCHFQLDGSASVPGCIAEMLVQSHLGEIHLLPALPGEFNTGKISGIRARGGYTVDLAWKDGNLSEAVIACPPGTELPAVRLKSDIISPQDHECFKIIKQ
jgi:alpha-L-fucosidase 2